MCGKTAWLETGACHTGKRHGKRLSCSNADQISSRNFPFDGSRHCRPRRVSCPGKSDPARRYAAEADRDCAPSRAGPHDGFVKAQHVSHRQYRCDDIGRYHGGCGDDEVVAAVIFRVSPSLTQRQGVVTNNNMGAILIERTREKVNETTFYEIVIWRLPHPVPGSTHHYKYRIALVVDDKCVLRYDN